MSPLDKMTLLHTLWVGNAFVYDCLLWFLRFRVRMRLPAKFPPKNGNFWTTMINNLPGKKCNIGFARRVILILVLSISQPRRLSRNKVGLHCLFHSYFATSLPL